MMNTDAVHRGQPEIRSRLARLGDAMGVHRRSILLIQWIVILAYAVLVTIPAFLTLPPAGASALNNLTLFAQFVFWGIWWPFVILSTMLLGRVWCGVLCPEGTLTEFASRHGKNMPIPRWLRWSGWPFFAFVATTVYGQLISVYDYPKAALVVLGGSTLAAMVVGYLYGKEKRVWCRYLCPVNGAFALLARLAPIHFRVDRLAWERYPERTRAVDCAPLIHIKHMKSASACHACGRCSGHRNAVQLAVRSANIEILASTPKDVKTGEAWLLIFGLLGVATGAFQWSLSPWFVKMKIWAAQWLIERDSLTLLQDNAPWWVLTHYPQNNDVFSWLDGLCILVYIFAVALVLSGLTWACLRAAAQLARLDWQVLSLGLVPLAGVGLFLGLSMLTVTHLKAEGLSMSWVAGARAAVLVIGMSWSGWLGARLLATSSVKVPIRYASWGLFVLPIALVGYEWKQMLFSW